MLAGALWTVALIERCRLGSVVIAKRRRRAAIQGVSGRRRWIAALRSQ